MKRTDPQRAPSSLVSYSLGQQQEACYRLTVQETSALQSAPAVISCVKSSLLFLHSSGCISSHLRGCCSSTGRGRNQLLLDVWAESCRAFSAYLSLSCGNWGCGLDSQARSSQESQFRNTVSPEVEKQK